MSLELVRAIIILFVSLLGLILYLAFTIYSCDSRWSGSGYATSYGLIKGCTVEIHDGKFIPENNIREF